MAVLSVNHIKELCKELDIKPSRKMGQNFLIDNDVLDDIIKTADLDKKDTVLEIGSGFGVLTQELVKKAGRVAVVELDRKIFDWLENRFNDNDNLKLVQGDIIKLLNCYIVKLLGGVDYKVVANLPYQITSRVLRLLLEMKNKPKIIAVMVQKEVAERICAKKGKMSVLSVMVQYYGKPEIIRMVARKSFWPAPEVDSAILYIKIQDTPQSFTTGQANSKFDEDFFKIVKIGFSSKRKMLKNNLANVYNPEAVEKILKEMGLGLKVRAQELGVEEWIELVNKFLN
ncbi:MAG: 16S rRNA (adenine(1518)-N(6)/adenine(1519)-N(6))-dimethyltransferase RsmA [Candidatus Kuenenbacteria bacterium]